MLLECVPYSIQLVLYAFQVVHATQARIRIREGHLGDRGRLHGQFPFEIESLTLFVEKLLLHAQIICREFFVGGYLDFVLFRHGLELFVEFAFGASHTLINLLSQLPLHLSVLIDLSL